MCKQICTKSCSNVYRIFRFTLFVALKSVQKSARKWTLFHADFVAHLVAHFIAHLIARFVENRATRNFMQNRACVSLQIYDRFLLSILQPNVQANLHEICTKSCSNVYRIFSLHPLRSVKIATKICTQMNTISCRFRCTFGCRFGCTFRRKSCNEKFHAGNVQPNV